MKSVTFLVLSGLLLSFVNARPVIVSQIWTAVSTEVRGSKSTQTQIFYSKQTIFNSVFNNIYNILGRFQ